MEIVKLRQLENAEAWIEAMKTKGLSGIQSGNTHNIYTVNGIIIRVNGCPYICIADTDDVATWVSDLNDGRRAFYVLEHVVE